ncbi:phage terminase, small subunit, putative, P27 family [Terrisporobacter glycolicus]|nr:phage terminase, small subunit, putative, P27 family [Terrisporobacter glycolicus]
MRPREPINLIKAKGKKHLTKDEVEKREAEEIKVNLTEIKAPTYLNAAEKKTFTEISNKLLTVGIFTELDEDCLARYIIARRLYISYTKMLTELIKKRSKSEMEIYLDDINKVQNMQDKSFKQCQSSARDLGLTISSRCKLIIPQKEVDDPDDEL